MGWSDEPSYIYISDLDRDRMNKFIDDSIWRMGEGERSYFVKYFIDHPEVKRIIESLKSEKT